MTDIEITLRKDSAVIHGWLTPEQFERIYYMLKCLDYNEICIDVPMKLKNGEI